MKTRPFITRTGATLVAGLWVLVTACSEPAPRVPAAAPTLSAGVDVVIADDASAGVVLAANDVAAAIGSLTGAPRPVVVGGRSSASAKTVVWVRTSSAAETAEQGFTVHKRAWPDGQVGLEVLARTQVGAQNGLYTLAHDLGARYLHPEETFLPPVDAAATLPWSYDGAAQGPHFSFRGLHEHTQHPTPASDFLMRLDDPAFRTQASNWLKWLARNRNNAASFHMLKTVDLAKWVPYYTGVVDEGHSYGIRMGFVTSYADQQQNNYKHIDELDKGADGKPKADDVQIKASLDTLLSTGVDWVAFQIGTSEFTKPKDARVLQWMSTTLSHLADKHPGVKAYAWIHTTCDLKDEEGGYFYHLPLQAGGDFGAWVHTTMFYTLSHPAPVYHCQDFSQQVDFLKQADGKRELVYFPETAWWLGFDNNVPLTMPITGWSRAHDVQETLSQFAVTGHMTFTTGREWGYWRYDHHVLGLGWDGALTWDAYLTSIEPLFGANGEAAHQLIAAWTELQRSHFYVTNPLIYFYIAGELAQDEIGQQAGILARRPKPAFHTVLAYKPDAWAAWVAGDFQQLQDMQVAYADAFAKAPKTLSEGTPQQQRLYRELHTTYDLYVKRVAHTVALYGAVVAMRPWRDALAAEAAGGAKADEALRAKTLAAAEAKLAEAQGITQAVLKAVKAQEADYRYPVAQLARPKPKTLTSYPFGYIEQTSTGHFWVRRDKQLASLIKKTYGTGKQAWTDKPAALFVTDKDKTTLQEPKHPLAGNVLSSFMPRMLVGATLSGDQDAQLTLQVGIDNDSNGLPDGDSEQSVSCAANGETYTGVTSAFSLEVFSAAGESLGDLSLLKAAFTAVLKAKGGVVQELSSLTIAGATPTKAFLAMMMQVGGIDEAGASALIASVFGLPAGEPLPPTLPVVFAFTFEPVL